MQNGTRGTPDKSLSICVLGAGAAGLAIIKVLKDSPEFKAGLWSIEAFEEREDIGGVWLPGAPSSDNADEPPPTPMYDSIFTNLPHPVMCYPSFWFPPETFLFPKAQVVEDYLKRYSAQFNLAPHIHVSTSVVETQWTGKQWCVKTQKKRKGTTSPSERSNGSIENGVDNNVQINHYDKLVIANGHYHVPFFPPIPGLESWREAGRVTHSAWYRNPDSILKSRPGHRPNRVLVVGGGYSGIDIASELADVCETVVHAAPGSDVRQGSEQRKPNIRVMGRVVCLSDLKTDVTKSNVVYFDDGSLEWGIDHIVLATGYILDFSFFKDIDKVQLPSDPDSCPMAHRDRVNRSNISITLPDTLTTSPFHILPLAHHLFPITPAFPPSAAAFVGLPLKVAPFPLFEAQAHAIAHVYAHPEAVDSPAAQEEARKEMQRKLDELCADEDVGVDGVPHAWHMFKGREQFEYRDKLHAFAGLSLDGTIDGTHDTSVLHFEAAASSGKSSPISEEGWRVPEWTKEMYANMGELRTAWKELVQEGKGESWVRGVGFGKGAKGRQEWVHVMHRILIEWREKHKDNSRL